MADKQQVPSGTIPKRKVTPPEEAAGDDRSNLTDLQTLFDPPALLSLGAANAEKSKSSSKNSSRATSPVTRSQGPPREVIIKCGDQATRFSLLEDLADQLKLEQQWSALLLDEYKLQVEDLIKQLTNEHALLQVLWSAEVAHLPYYKENLYRKAQQLALRLKRDIATLKAQLPPAQTSAPVGQGSSQGTQGSKLPDIHLPRFDGNYADWPHFRDMFQSMIYRNQQLSPVQKLHYLRSCLSGEPAQIVAEYPLEDSSLEPAMKSLKERFNNRRLIIKSYLDQLISLTPLTSKSAQGLNNLSRTLSKVQSGLGSLKVGDQLGDMLLVYLITRNFDRSTKEAWETSLGATQDFPTTQRLQEFLKTRTRALENSETPTAQSAKPPTNKGAIPKARTAHAATRTQQQAAPTPAQQAAPSKTATFTRGATAHPCDYCSEDHYVVACPQFRALTLRLRMEVVDRKRLCYNCLGRHSVRACKSTYRCKTCNAAHHTMLHGFENPPVTPSSSDTSGSSSHNSSVAKETPQDAH